MVKSDKNKAFIFIAILFLVLIVVIAISSILGKTSTQEIRVGASLTDTGIPVTASEDTFTPSDFELGHFDRVILSITAVDKDYIFQLPEFGINASIPMGEITNVKLVGLAVGTHEFTCSETCRGSVTVYGKSDEEN